MRSRFLLLASIAFLLTGLALPDVSRAADKSVLIVLSRDQAEYREFADALRQTLASAGGAVEVRLTTAADAETLFADGKEARAAGQGRPGGGFAAGRDAPAPDMVVTVGAQAARLIAQRRMSAPVLHTFVPRQLYQELARDSRPSRPRHHSAVYLDQPLGRQLDLVRLALPDSAQLAVILGPATAALQDELQVAARAREFEVQSRRLTEPQELIPLLRDVLDGADVLLALPDPLVYNSQTVHHLLIASYHRKVPVVGFSRAFVEAGALLAVYSTPAQMGRQAAEVLQRALAAPDRGLPPPQYPKYFTIAVNHRVAASLGIEIDSEQSLLNQLQSYME